MNTAPPYHLGFFAVASSRSGLRIRNDEVVGSIPTSSTKFLPNHSSRLLTNLNQAALLVAQSAGRCVLSEPGVAPVCPVKAEEGRIRKQNSSSLLERDPLWTNAAEPRRPLKCKDQQGKLLQHQARPGTGSTTIRRSRLSTPRDRSAARVAGLSLRVCIEHARTLLDRSSGVGSCCLASHAQTRAGKKH